MGTKLAVAPSSTKTAQSVSIAPVAAFWCPRRHGARFANPAILSGSAGGTKTPLGKILIGEIVINKQPRCISTAGFFHSFRFWAGQKEKLSNWFAISFPTATLWAPWVPPPAPPLPPPPSRSRMRWSLSFNKSTIALITSQTQISTLLVILQ